MHFKSIEQHIIHLLRLIVINLWKTELYELKKLWDTQLFKNVKLEKATKIILGEVPSHLLRLKFQKQEM